MDKDIEIEEAIFAFARRIQDGAARERYLREKCGGDPGLRCRIQTLLDAYASADTFLEVPVETTDAFDLAFGESEGVGSVVGSYELVEEIGRGGMGQVFRAIQSSPIRRQVALKTIRLGMGSRENIKRFEAERQAMAQLNHHGVAKLLDAGGTSTGRPWFVMELTVGQSITTYCQQNSLPLVDRLHLFESVCEAIQHAHQNSVIHCDIKPDNVVVTIVNGKPFCKVIDFGVAILLDRETNASSVKTAGVAAEANELPATIVGTPSYISPEQTVLSDHELDARCDVYSLGMLLYELLTDASPRPSLASKDLSISELRKLTHETTPVPPSQRVLQEPDSSRHVDELKGELDRISMKAIEIDREQRYQSVAQLAADLRRYLKNEPVTVIPRPPLDRLAKRRQLSVVHSYTGILGLCLIALAGLTIFAGWTLISKKNSSPSNKKTADRRTATILDHDAVNELKASYENYFRGRVNNYHEGKMENVEQTKTSFATRYLHRLRDNQSLVLKGASGKVFDIAFSPDGQRLIACMGDQAYRLDIWNVATWQLERSISGFENDVNCVQFSNDGTKFVTTDDAKVIRVWDLISGQELSRLAGFNQSLATVYLGQDQRTVITSEIDWNAKTGTTWICDLQDPTKRKEHSGLVLLDVHDQSQVAALVDDSGTVTVRSVPSLELISILPEPQLKTTCGKFSRSGEQLATGNVLGTTVLSRLSDLKCEKLARHDPTPDVVTDVVFSINGRFLIETNGIGVVQIWDTSTRSVQKVIKTSVDEAWSLAASPDGKWLAVGCIDGRIELFSMPEIGELRGISRRWEQSNLCCAIDPCTKNYAVLEPGPTIRIYSSDDNSEVRTLPLNPEFVWEQIAYSNGGRSLWVGDNGGRILKLDVASGEIQQSISTYELPIARLVVSRDDRFLGVSTLNAAIESSVVRSGVWDAQSGKEVFRLPMKVNENTQILHHVTDIVNNSEAITVQDNLAMRFDFRTGKELLPRFEDRKGWIFMASQVPHSESVLIGLRDSTVIIWDIRNNKITHEFTGMNSTLSAIAFTKEGETLVTATYSGEIRLWDLTTGLQICELFGAGGEINHVWFSEDEHRLLAFVKSQGSSQVIHWDAR